MPNNQPNKYDDPRVESKVYILEEIAAEHTERLADVERKVNNLTERLTGSLDGTPGILTLLQTSIESSRINNQKLTEIMSLFERQNARIEQLNFNWMKASGIVIGVMGVMTVIAVLVKLVGK